MGNSEHTPSEIITRLAANELLLKQLLQALSLHTFVLNDTEKQIVAALRREGKPLTAAVVAKRMGVGNNANFRTILRFLVRLAVLGKAPGNGYVLLDSHDSATVRVCLDLTGRGAAGGDHQSAKSVGFEHDKSGSM